MSSFVETGPVVLEKKILEIPSMNFAIYLDKSWPFIETRLTLYVLCQVWLRLVQWFWRRRLKCEKFMITTTTTKTEILIRKALEPLSSSYKPVYQIMLCVERKPHGFRQWLKHSWVKGIQVCSSEKQCLSIIEDNRPPPQKKMKYYIPNHSIKLIHCIMKWYGDSNQVKLRILLNYYGIHLGSKVNVLKLN